MRLLHTLLNVCIITRSLDSFVNLHRHHLNKSKPRLVWSLTASKVALNCVFCVYTLHLSVLSQQAQLIMSRYCRWIKCNDGVLKWGEKDASYHFTAPVSPQYVGFLALISYFWKSTFSYLKLRPDFSVELLPYSCGVTLTAKLSKRTQRNCACIHTNLELLSGLWTFKKRLTRHLL